MAEDKKKKEADFTDFRRYRDDEMTPAERHRFEKRLLEDPFLADAWDGFEAMPSVSETERRRIARELNLRLENRIVAGRRRIFPLWAYASAAGIIVALGAAWLVFLHHSPDGVVSPMEMKIPAPDEASSQSPEKAFRQAEARTNVQPKQQAAAEEDNPVPGSPDRQLARAVKSPSESTPGAPGTTAYPGESLREEREVRMAAVPRDAVSGGQTYISGRVVDPKGSGIPGVRVSPLPGKRISEVITDTSGSFALQAPAGDSLLLSAIGYRSRKVPVTGIGHITLEPDAHALSEVVITGYTRQEKRSTASARSVKDADASGLIQPQPAAGWEKYHLYLEEKTRSARMEGAVILDFTVAPDGSLAGFSARGKRRLQKEAIGIIRNGPAWTPAYLSGRPVEGQARVTLEFRK